MDNNTENDVSENSIIVKQVQYAWLWSSMPWVIALAALFYIGIIPEPTIASIIILIIAVPRYLMCRGTAYILKDDALIYQRGGIFGSQKYRIPFDKSEAGHIVEVGSSYGNFGRTLGYQVVYITLDTGSKHPLSYLPVPNDVESHILERIPEYQELKDESSDPDSEDLEDNQQPDKSDA